MNRAEIESAIRFVYREALRRDDVDAMIAVNRTLPERIKEASVVLFAARLDQLGGDELEASVETIRGALIHLKEHGTI